ncbi:hypothetical protein [Novosphingobium terrae]|uniref:hypothetical protein n=1 Tax=Novosphingobium terrae TaxID=2726189 RepID=UPI001F13FDB5|nr:hypothetical protein [Novosphingobium terrae]
MKIPVPNIAPNLGLTLAAGLSLLSAGAALADPAPFDLAGPDIRISVTRQGVTLPIAAVPHLAAGDKVKVEAALPKDESAHYLLIAAFLRDPTNPPPNAWFDKAEAWKRAGHGGGPIELTVPDNAQHLVLYLAPETGGDFKTLRDAVQARPGAFVRAAQDLEQASLDRSRYDAYLSEIKRISATQPEALAHLAPMVADSLRIKINEACLQRQSELQANCLLDSKQSVVLGSDDTSSSSALSASATDLALSLSATPQGGFGYFSPYISAVRDIVGIFGAMRTAKYQYIPALGAAHEDRLSLALNTPPSFANPKSVLMAALPAVKPAPPPVLHVTTASSVPCFGAKSATLAMVGAPLLYATTYGHDLALRVHLKSGDVDLPLTPDASRGGLVIGQPATPSPDLSGPVTATMHGMWGYDAFTGPEVTLQSAGSWQWQANGAPKGDGQMLLTGAPASCVTGVTVTPANGAAAPVVWKADGEHGLAVTLPATSGKPEPVTLTILGPEGTHPASITVEPVRQVQPVAQITAHSSEPIHPEPGVALELSLNSPDEIPADTRLSFTLKAREKEHFSPRDQVEVATVNGDASAKLAFGSGLTLVDQGILVANLTPAQALGASAFGPLRARLLRGGVAGEWMSLGMLVRLPKLRQVTCPAAPPTASATPCSLSGEGLYLLASVAAKQDFDGAVSVPEGYPGFTIKVPHPAPDGTLFLRLHDAPEVVNRLRVTGSTGP